MNTFETIMIYAFAFLLVAPHLGMVLAVIWTILSPGVKKPKNTDGNPVRKQGHSTIIDAQNQRSLLQSNQYMSNAHEHTTRMAQDAHDTAVRDAWAMHDNADSMAQSAHDTAVNDHNFAVDLNDHMVNDPGFGCGPFF
jgi:hypothetical protein